jgi:hypothetical protein
MAIRSPWGATPRTPRSRETWSPRGEAGRANGQSTAALSAATASSFTGNLRAARCVARQAGSMLSGGRSRQLPDGVGLLSGTRSQRRRLHAPSPPAAEESIRYLRPGKAGASLEKGRRRKSSRSSPPLVRSYARTESGVELPRRARPPPAAERGRAATTPSSTPTGPWRTRAASMRTRSRRRRRNPSGRRFTPRSGRARGNSNRSRTPRPRSATATRRAPLSPPLA